MSDKIPEPGSPEALAKAEKVKSLFMMIAAANIVVIFVIFFVKQPKSGTPPPLETAPKEVVQTP